jgi:putative membrane protein
MAETEIRRSAEKIKESAVRMKDSTARMERGTARMERETARMEASADRRTELAADRTVFAAERTYAAWVRTGLVALASGVGARPFLEFTLPHWLIVATGTVLVLFSIFCFGAAVWRHLYPGPPPPIPDVWRIHPSVLIVVNGALVLAALAALVGIWFGRAPVS